MKHEYRMYGWDASMFSGKVRGYLNYKGLDYEERKVSLYDLMIRLPRATGARAMPAVQDNTGQWLADTPLIIDELERRHPASPVSVNTPRQRIASLLLENWFDDAWAKVCMHTRWSYPENWDKLIKHEWGSAMLPFAPRVGEWIASKMGREAMTKVKFMIGISPGQNQVVERWSLLHLDTLNAHFTDNLYLLGGRPTIADYACLGVMHSHLNRDPWPRREWMNARPDLQAWVERTHSGTATTAELFEDDAIPSTLTPIFYSIANEFIAYIENAVERLRQHVSEHSLVSGSSIPRVLDDITFPTLGGDFTCMPNTYSLWRQQRLQHFYRALPAAQQESVDAWCRSIGRADLLTMDLGPQLKRDGLGAALV